MQLRRYAHWRPLVAGIVAGGLGVGGAFYAASAASGPPVVAATRVAPPSQDEDAPPGLPRDPARPVLEASPDSAGPVLEGPAPAVVEPAGPVAKPGVTPAARRVIGEVTAISPALAHFTVRTPDGAETTFRVLDTTVFKAGYDRPYNFGLLKPGDGANVTARMMGPGQASGGRPKPAPGGAAPKRARPADGAAESDPGLVAGQVVVRPASDAAYRGAAKPGATKPGAANPGATKPGEAKKGASDGAGQ